MSGANAARQTKLESLCPNRKEVAIWPLHRHGISEVNEMDRDGASILPHGYINQTRSINFNHRRLRVGPKNCVAQQFEVISAQHLPESPIDIEGKVRYATSFLAEACRNRTYLSLLSQAHKRF